MMKQNEWYPICFESRLKYQSWVEARNYAHEVASVCDDCDPKYSMEMQKQNRCNPQEAIYQSTNSKKPCKLKIIQNFT
jgi:hypothetical protein